jgi:uncharacterized membrane-anchored protein
LFENRAARALFRLQERVLGTTVAAMIYDVLGVLLYVFDIYTDIKVRWVAVPERCGTHNVPSATVCVLG